MEQIPDEKLVSRYLDGDERALEALVKRYLPLVYGFSKQYTGDPDKAADIAQETFIKAWRRIKTFDRNRSFKVWIFAIAKNTALDWLRRREALPFSFFSADGGENHLANIVDPLPPPSAVADRNMAMQKIGAALRGLPEHYRSVVSMRHKDGLSFREIAKELRKPLNTAKSWYRRAVLLIRQETGDRL